MFSIKFLKTKVFSQLRKQVKHISDIPDDSRTDFNQKQFQQFKKTLKNSNIMYKDGYTSIQTECRICNRFNNKPMAFVNKTTGSFLCPTCDQNQPLSNVLKYYDNNFKNHNAKEDLPILKALDSFKEYFNPLWSEYQTITQDTCNLLKIPGLEASFLRDLNVKYNSKDKRLHFPLRNAAGLTVGEKILHLNNMQEETIPLEICSGVLLYSSLKATKAILVLNTLDFLSLSSQKIDNLTVVCLPYGLKSLPLQCLPVLEYHKELVLWFDFDLAGWDVGRHFSRKLDEKRCLFIRPTDTQLTPYKALRKRFNLKHILNRAEPILHKSITTFSSLKQDILSELQNIEKVNGVKWKRYPILNRLLKGHRKGELTILTGPTGCGKTTFMSEYSLDLAMQGVSTLWGSFEIRNTRLASTLLRQYVGYPLDDKLHEFDYWSSELEKYPIYFMTFHGQQTIKVVMEAIDHAQYVHDIHHVIIDNVQFMMGVSTIGKTDKFWEQDAIIAAFRTFATTRNVHVTLVMHPRKERDSEDLTTSSIFGSAKATQEADNVLIIQDRRLTSVRGKKFLQVAKNRYSGDLGIMPMDFDKDGLSYARKKKEKEPDSKNA